MDLMIRFEIASRGAQRLAMATVVTPAMEVTGKVSNNAIRAL